MSAGFKVGDLYVAMGVDTKPLTTGIRTGEKQLTDSLDTVEKRASGLGGAFSRAGDALGKLGVASLGLQALTSGAQGLGEAIGIGLVSEMEQTRAQFLAFTKDAGETDRLLAGVREEAAKTPFAFRELASATASLIPAAKRANVPIEDLTKTAEILAASNPAQGLEGAAVALREAVSGDFTSVIERFNLPRERINQLKAEGVPALEAVQRAMNEMGIDASLVAGMANTASGRWSTFMDTIDTLKVGIATPIFDVLSTSLASLQTGLDGGMPTLQAWATAVGTTLAGALQGDWEPAEGVTEFHTAVGSLGTTIGNVTRFFQENQAALDLLINALKVGAVVYAAITVATTAYSLATSAAAAITTTIRIATTAFTAAQWLLNAALAANPIGIVVIALAALAAGLVIAYNNSAEFRAVVDGLWQAFNDHLLPVLKQVWEWLGKVAEAVGPVLALALQAVVRHVTDLWKGFEQVVSFVKQVVTWIGNLGTELGRLTIPDWLTPGSPTPFELGLRGITAALRELDRALPTGGHLLRLGATPMPALPDAGAGRLPALAGMARVGGMNVTAPLIGSISVRDDADMAALQEQIRALPARLNDEWGTQWESITRSGYRRGPAHG